MRLLRSLLLACIGCFCIATTATAAPSYLGASVAVLNHTTDGKAPTAPADDLNISWDSRIAQRISYSSRATNIVGGTGGEQNVYMISRKSGWGKNGTFWNQGATKRISRSYNGQPTNGDSWSPVASGTTGANDKAIKPTCLVFVSNASNIVRGDNNQKADIFLYNITTGKTRRLPTNGSATDVAVDGYCHNILYSSSTGLYKYSLVSKGHLRIKKGITINPHLSFRGKALSFERGGKVYIKQPGRGIQLIGKGSESSIDSGNPNTRYGSAIRALSYTNNGNVYVKKPGHRAKFISRGNYSRMTSGGTWTVYAKDNFMWVSIANNPRRYCPVGTITDVATSARGNYIAFACSDSNKLYLGYLGPK